MTNESHKTPEPYTSVPSAYKTSTNSFSAISITPKSKMTDSKVPAFGFVGPGSTLQEKENLKIVVVGDRSVGKTCMVISYGTSKFPANQPPTVLEAYKGNTKYEGREVQLDIFDTAGHEDFQRMRPISYNKADVIIICFSLVDRDSLTNAHTKWFKEVRTLGPKCPIILCGTKMDLREKLLSANGAKLGDNVVTYNEGRTLARNQNFSGYVECSAANLQRLEHVIYVAIDSVHRFRGDVSRSTSINLVNDANQGALFPITEPKKKWKCSVL